MLRAICGQTGSGFGRRISGTIRCVLFINDPNINTVQTRRVFPPVCQKAGSGRMRVGRPHLLKIQEHALRPGFPPGVVRNASFSTGKTHLYVIQWERDRAGHRRLFGLRNVLPAGMCRRFDFEGIMVIAERTLTLRTGVMTNTVPVRVHAPQRTMPQRWTCRYEIGWPGENTAADIHGVDAVQALGLALQTIGAEIYASDYHKSGNLLWDAPGNGYGFPVVPTLRDLLEGDDKKYL